MSGERDAATSPPPRRPFGRREPGPMLIASAAPGDGPLTPGHHRLAPLPRWRRIPVRYEKSQVLTRLSGDECVIGDVVRGPQKTDSLPLHPWFDYWQRPRPRFARKLASNVFTSAEAADMSVLDSVSIDRVAGLAAVVLGAPFASVVVAGRRFSLGGVRRDTPAMSGGQDLLGGHPPDKDPAGQDLAAQDLVERALCQQVTESGQRLIIVDSRLDPRIGARPPTRSPAQSPGRCCRSTIRAAVWWACSAWPIRCHADGASATWRPWKPWLCSPRPRSRWGPR